jgi:hypothetical protein
VPTGGRARVDSGEEQQENWLKETSFRTDCKKEATMNTTTEKPLTFRFVDVEADVRLELSNDADHALKCVEILTVFLKDMETPGGGPSQAHIRFDQVDSIRPKENVMLSHKTWINGKIAAANADLLARLRVIAGAAKPYVLDISWQDPEGKTRFQRIPVGH